MKHPFKMQWNRLLILMLCDIMNKLLQQFILKTQCPRVFNIVHELYVQSQILSNSSQFFFQQFHLKSTSAVEGEEVV